MAYYLDATVETNNFAVAPTGATKVRPNLKDRSDCDINSYLQNYIIVCAGHSLVAS